jgi:hypothetical protein
MPDLNRRDYYAARASKAREIAAQSRDPEIARIHARMAASYEELVEMMPSDPPLLQVARA